MAFQPLSFVFLKYQSLDVVRWRQYSINLFIIQQFMGSTSVLLSFASVFVYNVYLEDSVFLTSKSFLSDFLVLLSEVPKSLL